MSLTKTVQKCLHYIYPEMIIRYGNVLHKEDEGDFTYFCIASLLSTILISVMLKSGRK